ncbi:MAG: thiamine diphosphokinase [Treponemataceae bacterium]
MEVLNSVFIICGGELCTFSEQMEFALKECNTVIACDGGFDAATLMGIKPDILIGDMDSIQSEEAKISSDVKIIKLPKEKDDTDTMFAIKYAIEKGAKKIVLSCCFGLRLDHTFANLQSLLYAAKSGCQVLAFGKNTVLHVLCGTNSGCKNFIELPYREDAYFSVFSAGEICTGVNIKGAKYNIDNVQLTSFFPIGISNQWVKPQVQECSQTDVKNFSQNVHISLKSGFLFVMEIFNI